MKFAPVLLFYIVFGSTDLFAQYSKQYDNCLEKAETQLAMLMCASEEAARADAVLNDTYRRLISALATQPNTVPKIRAMERAWIVYRDAYIEATWPADDKQRQYGSIFPMEANLLRARLTQQQIEAIKDLLKKVGDSKQ